MAWPFGESMFCNGYLEIVRDKTAYILRKSVGLPYFRVYEYKSTLLDNSCHMFRYTH